MWLVGRIADQLHFTIQCPNSPVGTTDAVFHYRLRPSFQDDSYLVPETLAIFGEDDFLESGLVQRADRSGHAKNAIGLVRPLDIARSEVELKAAGRGDPLRPRQMLSACVQLRLHCFERGNIDAETG